MVNQFGSLIRYDEFNFDCSAGQKDTSFDKNKAYKNVQAQNR